MDGQRTVREHDAHAKEKPGEAEQLERLQDLDVTKEAGEKITGGIPRLNGLRIGNWNRAPRRLLRRSA